MRRLIVSMAAILLVSLSISASAKSASAQNSASHATQVSQQVQASNTRQDAGRADTDDKITVALIAGIVSLIVAVVTSITANRQIERQYRLEFAAERVVNRLLTHSKWRLRTFEVIQHHLGGFEENELRKILVRAGAIRYNSKSGKELWGLLERTLDLEGVDPLPYEPWSRHVANPVPSQTPFQQRTRLDKIKLWARQLATKTKVW